MPQLEEDEWPDAGQPTTREQEDLKEREPGDGVRSDYPPELPPDALPTKD